ncbi:MAG: DUF190 domain-containing protein [Gammaproteobacteria bacterium]
MTLQDVLVVRVYLAERGGQLEALLDLLHDEAQIRGWTVYRGVSGYGSSGRVRSARLVDLALDLPVTVEFFDAPARVEAVLERVVALAGAGHVVSWPARMALA